MTSLARWPAATICESASRALLMSGFSPDSQRRPALARVTMPVSGWLTSCAMEAESSPAVAMRLECVSSAMVWRATTSAR